MRVAWITVHWVLYVVSMGLAVHFFSKAMTEWSVDYLGLALGVVTTGSYTIHNLREWKREHPA